jgi:ligand-binding sensor domain-containing protein
MNFGFKKSTLLFILFSIHFVSLAREYDFKFNHISTEAGLSYNSVTSIVQDKYNFIWIATRNGLNRFDGNTYKIYNTQNSSLKSNVILNVFSDGKENLWVYTDNAGLYLYDYDSDKFGIFTGNLGFSPAETKDNISSITGDADGNIWISLYIGQIYLYNSETKRFQQVYSQPKKNFNQFNSLFFENDTSIFVGSNNGLFLFNPKNKVIREIKCFPDISNLAVGPIYSDKENDGWFGSNKGLYCLNKTNRSITNLNQEN